MGITKIALSIHIYVVLLHWSPIVFFQLAAAQQEVLQQQAVSVGHLRNQRHLAVQYAAVAAASASPKLPALQLKPKPVADQVLAQMPVKTEAPSVEELRRLLRERSDRNALNDTTSLASCFDDFVL